MAAIEAPYRYVSEHRDQPGASDLLKALSRIVLRLHGMNGRKHAKQGGNLTARSACQAIAL